MGYDPAEPSEGLNVRVEEIETSRIISRIFGLSSKVMEMPSTGLGKTKRTAWQEMAFYFSRHKFEMSD